LLVWNIDANLHFDVQQMIVDFFNTLIEFGIGYFWLFMFLVLALVAEIGFQLGQRKSAVTRSAGKEPPGISALTGGMLGLVAFTLALTLSFAQTRFEARRAATLEEANAIGTAWLRTDLAGEAGKPMAAELVEYARYRLTYLKAGTEKAAAASLKKTGALQTQIWQQAVKIANATPTPPIAALLSSLNDAFDASLVQRYATESRVPTATSLMLLAGAMLSVGALGYQLGLAGSRQAVLALLLFFMLSGGMVLVIDFSRPRAGLTRMDATPLIWTLDSMTPATPH
jgi:hypothetical protein